MEKEKGEKYFRKKKKKQFSVMNTGYGYTPYNGGKGVCRSFLLRMVGMYVEALNCKRHRINAISPRYCQNIIRYRPFPRHNRNTHGHTRATIKQNIYEAARKELIK